MKIRSFKNTRVLHKWIGILSLVFILILSVSGFLLMHPKEFGIDRAQISGKYLPEKYFQVQHTRHPIQSLVAGSALYAGTNIGVYRSQDAGKSWAQINQGLFDFNIHALATNSISPDIIYAGTNQGIFKSEDAGDNWSEWFDESSGLIHTKINDLALHPKNSNVLFAATDGGVYQSLDAGESWETVYTEHAIQMIKFSSANSNILYASGTDGTIRTTNMGHEWSRVWENQVPTITGIISLNTDPEFLYTRTHTGLYKSFNAGRNWVLDANFKNKPIHAMLVQPSDLSRIYLAYDNEFYSSQDGGDSWKMLSSLEQTHNDQLGTSVDIEISHIEILNDSSLYVGTTSGLYASNNGGQTWENIDLSGAVNQLSADEMKMDVVKLVTEIHTGRFFGSFFFMLVDLSTLGLIVLALTGILITYYRAKLKNRTKLLEDSAADRVIKITETTNELSTESQEIHDMIEHITEHIEKCQLVYMKQEKKEITEISRHLNTLDKKMHRLMGNLGELDKATED
ncbi:MAG: hypothetical protein HOL15_05690 [Nitrospinaceae bacterium]|nr:hypothetical protein [Nitrospinaceae bacterium]